MFSGSDNRLIIRERSGLPPKKLSTCTLSPPKKLLTSSQTSPTMSSTATARMGPVRKIRTYLLQMKNSHKVAVLNLNSPVNLMIYCLPSPFKKEKGRENKGKKKQVKVT